MWIGLSKLVQTNNFLFLFLKPAKPADFEDVKASFVKRIEDLFEDISTKYAELQTWVSLESELFSRVFLNPAPLDPHGMRLNFYSPQKSVAFRVFHLILSKTQVYYVIKPLD